MNITRILRSAATLGLLALPFALRAESPIAPHSDEAQIAATSARLLDRAHFLGERFDDAVSERFFDNYLKALDPGRLHLLQSDIDEFTAYRDALDDLTLGNGDTTPAHKIYARFVERLGQRVAYAKEALAKGQFDFSGNDTWRTQRDDLPWPRDVAEARGLWESELRSECLQEKLAGKQPAEIARTLLRRYDRMLHTTEELARKDVFEIYMNALAHAYDPHSDYMGPSQMEDFAIQMNLKLCGVGATLQSDDGYCKIKDLVAGGPAARCGKIHPGDRIVAVQQDKEEAADIVDMPLHKAVELIRGPKGTRVLLTIIPANAADESVRKTVALVRDEIRLEEQEAKARIVDMPRNGGPVRMGVIDLPAFYSDMDGRRGEARKSATEDVARLLRKLVDEGVEGVVLDLRRNGGGSLDEAISLTGLFIPTGPVVQTKDASGRLQVGVDTDPQILYKGPLVVLTSRLSASASEIVAGALQDLGRALIIGDPSTFGKGTVQSLVPLADVMKRNGAPPIEDPGSLKLTIAKFYRPGGSSTQLRGVAPDIALPSPTDLPKIAELEMDNAIHWDAVAPARFAPLNLVGPYLPELQSRSASRIEADPEFAWLREDASILRKKMSEPTISLNEAARLREKQAAEKRIEQRKVELAKLPKTEETVYLIRVASAGRPGLPSPEPLVSPESNREPLGIDGADGVAAPDATEPAATDPVLREAKHILADYIDLTRRPLQKNVVRSGRSGQPAGFGG